jgi:hypothetical protein
MSGVKKLIQAENKGMVEPKNEDYMSEGTGDQSTGSTESKESYKDGQ